MPIEFKATGWTPGQDDSWYEAIADALRIIRKRWYSDTTDEEDAFVLAYADEIAPRPETER